MFDLYDTMTLDSIAQVPCAKVVSSRPKTFKLLNFYVT